MINEHVDIVWDKAESIIKSCIDQAVPKKVVTKKNSLPWVNKDIRKLCTNKNSL